MQHKEASPPNDVNSFVSVIILHIHNKYTRIFSQPLSFSLSLCKKKVPIPYPYITIIYIYIYTQYACAFCTKKNSGMSLCIYFELREVISYIRPRVIRKLKLFIRKVKREKQSKIRKRRHFHSENLHKWAVNHGI